MKRCELYLFRHAQTQWNLERRFQGHQDSPLSEFGIEQSKKMGNVLEAINPDVLITSTLKRTKETARIAMEEWGQIREIVEMDALKEAYFGPWEGITIEQVKQTYPNAFHQHKTNPHLFQLEGIEGYEQIQKRATDALKQIAIDYPSKRVAVVTHGLLLLCVLAAIREIPLQLAREKIEIPDNTQYVRVDWLVED